jgi:CDP-diacylglycerol--glycerol-3-phosphate 3-phosphatidyltransferase
LNIAAEVKSRVRSGTEPVGHALARLGLSANALTLIGLGLNVGAAAIVGAGWLTAGGIVFLVASAFDTLDGAVARASGTASSFGAFLDSLTDRYAEAVIFVPLLLVFASQQQPLLQVACTAALVGSLLVSYARARAEGLGVDCEIGLLQRPERVILLGAGLIVPDLLLAPVIIILAVVTNLTVLQRALHVRRLLAGARDGPPGVDL